MAHAATLNAPSLDASALPALPVIPLKAIVPWALFAGLLMLMLMLMLMYFVGAEQGATSVFSGAGVHEFLHDGRHLLGFPCH